jgi:hypothetical protein
VASVIGSFFVSRSMSRIHFKRFYIIDITFNRANESSISIVREQVFAGKLGR